jgi:transcriptional regulator with XRE-family HTH domain
MTFAMPDAFNQPLPMPPVMGAWPLPEPTSNTISVAAAMTTTLKFQGTQGQLIGAPIRPWFEQGPWMSHNFSITLFAPWQQFFGRTLVDNACVQSLAEDSQRTIPLQCVRLIWCESPSERSLQGILQQPHGPTAAQSLLSEIRTMSGLTLEEIAPLLGVSRRSLQNWRAQRRISARKEQRLRDLVDTLRAVRRSDPTEMRQILLDRGQGDIRPYDLLAEGRLDTVYSLMTGLQAPRDLSMRSPHQHALPLVPSMLARLSIQNDGPASPKGRVDLRRSRRLKR